MRLPWLHAGRDATAKELTEARAESDELRQQLESARSERQQVSEGLSSSQEAVARLTGTLQTVSDARDRLEAQVASTKVPPWSFLGREFSSLQGLIVPQISQDDLRPGSSNM